MSRDTDPLSFEVRFRGNLQPEYDLARKIGAALQAVFNNQVIITLSAMAAEEHSPSGQTPDVLRAGRPILTGQMAIVAALDNPELLRHALENQPDQQPGWR